MPSSTIHHPGNLVEFNALLAKNPFTIVDFYADWCPPCKMIAPIFEQLANYNPNLTFAKVNTDYAQDIAALYQVTAMPTFLFFKDGKVEGMPLQGAIPPVLMRLTGAFAQMARERKEQEAKLQEKKETNDAVPESSEEETHTVSGGYSMGVGSERRSDWRMSLTG